MAAPENRYHHFPSKDENARFVSSGRCLKVGLAILGASCLFLLSTIMAGVSTATSTTTNGYKEKLVSLISAANARPGQATLKLNSGRPSQPWPASFPLRGRFSPQLRGNGEGLRMVKATAGANPEAVPRRNAMEGIMATIASAALGVTPSWAAVEEIPAFLCDASCASKADKLERVKSSSSGLEYVDLVVGTGPKAIVGYQGVINYDIYQPNTDNKLYASTQAKGGSGPVDTRIGAGNLIKGMEEGIKTMNVGGIRRLYIPGELSWPKGLPAAPGRPRIQPNEPVMVDVQLLYIPGLGDPLGDID